MKYFEFLSLSSVGLCIACGDLLLAVSILGPSSFYLYLDFMDIEKWEQDAEVEALTPIGTFFSTLGNLKERTKYNSFLNTKSYSELSVGARVLAGFLYDSNVYNLGEGNDKPNGGLYSYRRHKAGNIF